MTEQEILSFLSTAETGAITDAIGCGLLVVIYISQKMLTSGPVSKTAG